MVCVGIENKQNHLVGLQDKSRYQIKDGGGDESRTQSFFV